MGEEVKLACWGLSAKGCTKWERGPQGACLVGGGICVSGSAGAACREGFLAASEVHLLSGLGRWGRPAQEGRCSVWFRHPPSVAATGHSFIESSSTAVC